VNITGLTGIPAGPVFFDLAIRAESAQLYPAAKMSDWILYQEKSNFADV
jgi:hypothetical protein